MKHLDWEQIELAASTALLWVGAVFCIGSMAVAGIACLAA